MNSALGPTLPKTACVARSTTRRIKSERGTQLVEMAMLCPFLVLLALGATDFARVSYTSITLANAARTGAQYALQSSIHAIDNAKIQTAACDEADDLDPSTNCVITVASSRFCRCPGATGVVGCGASPACTANAPKEVYATVTATKTFNTLVNYPGIPASVPMTRQATLRIQ
jgi:Flp pilus assembly protein TadG